MNEGLQTAWIYRTDTNDARIVHNFTKTGAMTERTIPIPKQTYDYYTQISADVTARVKNAGLLPGNDNLQGENVSTATMLALLTIHGEGIDVAAKLQEGQNYSNLITMASENQLLDHYRLQDKLAEILRPPVTRQIPQQETALVRA